jgi:hypothetical protein
LEIGCREAEFLDEIETKVLKVSFLLFTVTSTPLLTDFTLPPHFEQKWFETGFGFGFGCWVYVAFGGGIVCCWCQVSVAEC